MASKLTYGQLLERNTELEKKVKSLEKKVASLQNVEIKEIGYYRDRFFKISENANDVIYKYSVKHRRYEYISPQVKNFFGYGQQDFYDNPFLLRSLIYPDYLEQYKAHWKSILSGDMPDYIEIKMKGVDDRDIWVMQKNLVLTDEDGKVSSIEGVVADVTARKNAEVALIESEAQKEAILNNLPHLAWLKDRNGVYLSVNNNFADRYKSTIGNIIGKDDFDIYPSTVAKDYREQDLRVVSNKESMYIEEITNGSYWETLKAPIFNSIGEVIGITGIALEVTKRKESQKEIKEYSEKLAVQNVKLKLINDELKSAKDKAEEADRLKSAFLANMSHEIRTPMNAILGFATLLRDRKLTEEKQKSFINLINKNCRQLLHIISDIIDISKIEANQINIYKKNFDINRALEELALGFNEEIIAEGKAIELKTQYDFHQDDALIFTDKVRVEQVLTNLLSNALKFTEVGLIELGYEMSKDKNNIIFYVKDTGIGLCKEEREVIFERFRQGDSKYTKEYGGTGLGLSISKGLASKLGGDIWLESAKGIGSTFFFGIPLHKVAKLKKEKQLPNIDDFHWPEKTILIVEDEKANYSLLENIIQPTKAKILWAKDGVEAIETCRESDVDLVLMDIKMPRMNGIEATRHIKKLNREIPIIAQTAFAMPADEKNCIHAGCDDFLAKPLKVEDILLKIRKHMKVEEGIG